MKIMEVLWKEAYNLIQLPWATISWEGNKALKKNINNNTRD